MPDILKLYRNSKSKFTSGSDRICFLGANDFKEDFTCTNNLSRFLRKVLMKKIFKFPWLLFNMEISINSEHLGWKSCRGQEKISARCCKLNKSSTDWVIFFKRGPRTVQVAFIKENRFHQKSTWPRLYIHQSLLKLTPDADQRIN